MNEANYITEIIKSLEPWEVLDWHDGPRFYSCKDTAGQLYLIYWLDLTDTGEKWAYYKVSHDRYNALKSGYVSIRETLAKTEEGKIYIVNYNKNFFEVAVVRDFELSSDFLPEENIRLSLESKTLPDRSTTAYQKATVSNREVLDIAFYKKSNQYEFPAEQFGKIIGMIQSTIDAFACGKNSTLKSVPDEIKNRNQVFFTGVFASSFGIRLESNLSELIEKDSSNKAIKNLSAVLEKANNPDELLILIKEQNLLARSRFLNLLELLVDSSVSIKTEWADPYRDAYSTAISYDKLKQSFTKLNETKGANVQTNSYSGCTLVGINVKKDTFTLVDGDENIYTGKLASDLHSLQYKVPSVVDAKLKASCETNPVTGKEKWTYILIEIKAKE